MHPGMWGAIVGTLLGLAGGVVGTYVSIRSARSPRERRFLVRAAVLTWVGVSIFVALILTLSSPFKWLLWAPYAVALSLSIVWMNRRIARLRQEEQAIVE